MRNNIFYKTIGNNNIYININMSCDNNMIVVDYVFTIENLGENMIQFTISHEYDSLTDFIENPRKKYDYYANSDLLEIWVNVVCEQYFFHEETDSELHDPLLSLGCHVPDGINILYSVANNTALETAVLLFKKDDVQSTMIVDTSILDTKLVIKKIGAQNIYYGELKNKKTFCWISRDPHKLLNILENAYKMCFSSSHSCLTTGFNRAQYQLNHEELTDCLWTGKYWVKPKIFFNKTEFFVDIQIFSSDYAWKAKIRTSHKTRQSQRSYSWPENPVCTTIIYAPTVEKLVQTINEDDKLLCALIDDYENYRCLIKECVAQLRSHASNSEYIKYNRIV